MTFSHGADDTKEANSTHIPWISQKISVLFRITGLLYHHFLVKSHFLPWNPHLTISHEFTMCSRRQASASVSWALGGSSPRPSSSSFSCFTSWFHGGFRWFSQHQKRWIWRSGNKMGSHQETWCLFMRFHEFLSGISPFEKWWLNGEKWGSNGI